MKSLITLLMLPLLLTLPITSNAEPTSIQKQMMNENATMMDVFILRQNMNFAETDNSVRLSQTSRYPVIIKKVDWLDITPSISVNLDWDKGVFYINSFEYLGTDLNKFDLTLSNAKNLCLNVLAALDGLYLEPTLAAHEGYAMKSYTAGDIEQYDEFNNSLEFSAIISGYASTPRDDELISAAYSVMCRTQAIDTLFENVQFTFKGAWK